MLGDVQADSALQATEDPLVQSCGNGPVRARLTRVAFLR